MYLGLRVRVREVQASTPLTLFFGPILIGR